MVKTRHSGDLEEDLDDDFLTFKSSVQTRRVKYVNQVNGYTSDEMDTSTLGVRRSTRRGIREPVVMSSEESSDEDDDDEDEEQEEEAEQEDEVVDSMARTRRRTRNDLRGSAFDDATLNMNNNASRPRRKRHSSRSSRCSNQGSVKMNGELNGARRSSRKKQLTYGTYDQALIDPYERRSTRSKSDVSSPETKRRRKLNEVEVLRKEAGESIEYLSRDSRRRRAPNRDMYGMSCKDEEHDTSQGDTEDTGASSTEDDDTSEESNSRNGRRSYSMREHRPRTQYYTAPVAEPTRRVKRNITLFRESPPRSRKPPKPSYQSPARRRSTTRSTSSKKRSIRRRKAFHDSDSTSSSDSSGGGGNSSEDEHRFQKRKAKSMTKSRSRCLPMNFVSKDINAGILRDRTKAGSSLADIDPMSLDRSVTFDSVGGLGKHIKKLKEMVVFPLMYHEVFEKFKIAPPRGCLFYGPPGTGKTLVARALANECSVEGRKVAFFMRKGADCLSKWVGESERQLRLLFDQAYQMRPSIIFFDEIDGLAPVRSSRQDQIHSSIVSTLLALMDGLDNRGEIVVIGATNRLDSIDPALRRPGRFDREFLFPLPSLTARQQILKIHTKLWNPPIISAFLEELATRTVGYCGADLKSLCTEAALHALRRRYPQIYTSNDKLVIDVDSIEVIAKDFSRAMEGIVPASQRAVTSPGRSLCISIKPLLSEALQTALNVLYDSFPAAHLTQMACIDTPTEEAPGIMVELEAYSDDEDDAPSIYEALARGGRTKKRQSGLDESFSSSTFLNFASNVGRRPITHRPRILLAGEPGQGQTSHLAPALLHSMEQLPCHTLDLPALYAVSAKTAEESCATIFREACRTSPSIIYMPHIGQWWSVISDTIRSTFMALLRDLEPSTPLLILATSELTHSNLPEEIKRLFNPASGEVVTMQNPTDIQRRQFFRSLILEQVKKPPITKKHAEYLLTGRLGERRAVRFAKQVMEILPKAPPVAPRKLTELELKRLNDQEEAQMRELRLFLRDVLNKLGRDRKFGLFAKPVDEEDVPDYYEIITEPMDLSTMMSKIDLHQYQTVTSFLEDIDLIVRNALEYNPDKDTHGFRGSGRAIRHRACALKDTALAIINAEMDPEFEKVCKEIAKARAERGQGIQSNVPDYYFTKPLKRPGEKPIVEILATPESGEAKASCSNQSEQSGGQIPKVRQIIKRMVIPRKKGAGTVNKSPWCKPTRRRWRKVVVFIDEFGNEIPNPGSSKDQEASDAELDTTMEEEPKSERQSRSTSPKKDRCGSRSKSNSPTRSRSKSPKGARSKSVSPYRHGSRSPQRLRSRSKSPLPSQSKSQEVSPSGKSPRGRSPRAKASTSPRGGLSPRPKAISPVASPKSPKRGSQMEVDEGTSGHGRLINHEKALEIVKTHAKDVIVSNDALKNLLELTIRQTQNFTVDKLEKLYSRFTQCIYQHRFDHDKGDLIEDMKSALNKFCSSHW